MNTNLRDPDDCSTTTEGDVDIVEFLKDALHQVADRDERVNMEAMPAGCGYGGGRDENELKLQFLNAMNEALIRQASKKDTNAEMKTETLKPAKSKAMLRRERQRRQEARGPLSVMTKHGTQRSVQQSMGHKARSQHRKEKRHLNDVLYRLRNTVSNIVP